jgi:hypothetical protein
MIASFNSGLRWTLAQAVTQKHELGKQKKNETFYFRSLEFKRFLIGSGGNTDSNL